MSKFVTFLLGLTAFAPALFTYAGVSALNSEYCHAIWFLFFCAVLVVVCVDFLGTAKTRIQSKYFHAATVETVDNEVFGFLLVYLLPLITRDLANYNWPVWLLVTVLFCLVVSTGHGYHFNPLLTVLGYHFYKVTEPDGIPHILITSRRIYKTGEKLIVATLTDYVLLEKDPPR